MPPTCTICRHPDRLSIDRALLACEPFRNVAERTGTSSSSLFRHKQEHIADSMLKAHEAQEVAYGEGLLDQLRVLQDKTMSILAAAEKAGDLRGALLAFREARGCLELGSKLTGQLVERHMHLVAQAPAEVMVELNESLKALRERLESEAPAREAAMLSSVYEGEAALPKSAAVDAGHSAQ